MTLLAAAPTGWIVGYVIGGVVVVVVVALVVPILVLAARIGSQAQRLDDDLSRAVEHTSALAGLQTTIESAETITAGLRRGRHRLGG